MSKKKLMPIFALGGLLTFITPLALANPLQELPVFAEETAVNDKVVLRIMNMEDYIYVEDAESGYEDPDLIVQFEEWMKENTKYKNVQVVYDTTDTNETLLTQLHTGKSDYDLICPSDYMIQKMMVSDLLVPLNNPKRDELLSNYDKYASPLIRSRLDEITATSKNGETLYVGDYAVGYMWGTLGLLFNTDYYEDQLKLIKDMESWEILYNVDYNGTISIKDSMRDTYAAVLMYVYRDELMGYRARYENNEINSTEYNELIQKVFDRHDDETLKLVQESLSELKSNIFGLEVDSGKLDIVQGKIGINLAWSGDAVYSMSLGWDAGVELAYTIPYQGSNIWFDAWVMPKGDRTAAQEEVAYYFLNFISDPVNAAQNMDYTGYTPFIAGDSILELTREWYDIRYDEENETFDDSGNIDESWEEVDLSYFFNGTLETYNEEDMIFYSDCYFFEAENEETGETYSNGAVGQDFFCQFPDEETINRCAVMKDYGDDNDKVIALWEKFKSSALPTWAVILLVVEVVLIFAGISYFFISKKLNLRRRYKRKLENK